MTTEGFELFMEAASQCSPWPWFGEAAKFVDARMAQDGGHDWGHLGRVLSNARMLTWRSYDETTAPSHWPVIAAAVLFHDVVNLPKDSPQRSQASTMAAQVAAAYFEPRGAFDAQQLATIQEAIRCHSYSSGLRAQSLEAQIVSDADRLDALGVVGAARTFAVGAVMGRPLCHPFDPLALHRQADDSVWGVDHFYTKLFKLPQLMYTQAGRQVADARVAFMTLMLEQLGQEVLGQR